MGNNENDLLVDQQNTLCIGRDWGIYFGRLAQGDMQHQHYALQLSIAVAHTLVVNAQAQLFTTKLAALVQSQVRHTMVCNGPHLLVVVNPASALGKFYHKYYAGPVAEVENQLTRRLRALATDFGNNCIDRQAFIEQATVTLRQFEVGISEHDIGIDSRIQRAIEYLQLHHKRPVPVAEIADHCFLSESRFLHLFKEETGTTYKKTELWGRHMHALPKLTEQGIAKTALEFGFTDHAHFTRSFKDCFGFTPGRFIKNSKVFTI